MPHESVQPQVTAPSIRGTTQIRGGGCMDDQPVSEAARRYAAALKAAVQPFLDAGTTQRQLAGKTHCVPSTVSRYLSGKRIAPERFIVSLEHLAASKGIPLPVEDLRELRRTAEREGSTHARLRYSVEENDRLKNLIAGADRPDALPSLNSDESLPDHPQASEKEEAEAQKRGSRVQETPIESREKFLETILDNAEMSVSPADIKRYNAAPPLMGSWTLPAAARVTHEKPLQHGEISRWSQWWTHTRYEPQIRLEQIRFAQRKNHVRLAFGNFLRILYMAKDFALSWSMCCFFGLEASIFTYARWGESGRWTWRLIALTVLLIVAGLLMLLTAFVIAAVGWKKYSYSRTGFVLIIMGGIATVPVVLIALVHPQWLGFVGSFGLAIMRARF